MGVATVSGLYFLTALGRAIRDDWNPRKAGLRAFVVGLFFVQLAWETSISDAERAALAYNERIETEFHARHPIR